MSEQNLSSRVPDRVVDPEDYARFLKEVVGVDLLDLPVHDEHHEPETMGSGLDGIVAAAGAPRPPSSVGHEFHGALAYSTGGPQVTKQYAPEALSSPAPCCHSGDSAPITPAGAGRSAANRPRRSDRDSFGRVANSAPVISLGSLNPGSGVPVGGSR
jgi:hypothetical protein